ncbi:ABC transporter substrate-binding protein [Pelistega europaea]|uniref:ABC transporter substrate-binding protein n=2 Tax=Pelistega europaea TaxID=106147 RepID=A0A7Y4L9R3_9BURK|nr:ABC transporter substrate-binding protein [Pelistega europaea]
MLLLPFLLTACNDEQSSKEKVAETAQTQPAAEKKVINVGSDMTFPPYEYLEDGKPSGVDIEIMNKIAALDGSEVNWMDTRWANLIPGLKGKKFDVLFSSMYITKERLEQIDMIPYYKTDISLLVRGDATIAPKGPGDLCGLTVGTMKGTAFANQVQKISKEVCVDKGKPGLTVREFETSPQVTQALLAHAVEVQYDDAAVMMSAVKRLGDKVKITSTEEFFPIVGGIGIRKGDTATYTLLNDGIKKLKASGEFQKLLSSYGLKEPTEDDIANLTK